MTSLPAVGVTWTQTGTHNSALQHCALSVGTNMVLFQVILKHFYIKELRIISAFLYGKAIKMIIIILYIKIHFTDYKILSWTIIAGFFFKKMV